MTYGCGAYTCKTCYPYQYGCGECGARWDEPVAYGEKYLCPDCLTESVAVIGEEA